MANTIPPIPLKIPMLDQGGMMGQAWAKFMIELYQRAGGTSAPTNAEILVLVTELRTDVDYLDANVSNYLNQGPVL